MPASPEVAKLREARGSPSVLKAKLALIRSRLPDIRIIAFEGQDDKIVYSQWIRGVDGSFNYEPLVCDGKRGVRSLKNMCARDQTDLSSGVLFIVDHDFDGLDGFDNTDGVYCTRTYSFENHLVCTDVLDLILRDEFPCDGRPELRAAICRVFEDDYLAFLRITRPVNYRLYLARKLKIELKAQIPTSLPALAQVDILNVTYGLKSPHELIDLSRRPNGVEIKAVVTQFRQIDCRESYRGKFALKFFKAWLERLVDEYRKNELGLFDEMDNKAKIRVAEWTLSGFASKCPTPDCFRAFILAH